MNAVREPLARDLMSRQIVSIREDASLRELARLLNRRRISGVPVLDEKGRLVGVASKTDLVRAGWREDDGVSDFFSLPGEEGPGLVAEEEGRVAEIMSRGLLSVGEGTPASEIAKLMASAKVHRLLVTRRGELLGVISSLDLLKSWPAPSA